MSTSPIFQNVVAHVWFGKALLFPTDNTDSENTPTSVLNHCPTGCSNREKNLLAGCCVPVLPEWNSTEFSRHYFWGVQDRTALLVVCALGIKFITVLLIFHIRHSRWKAAHLQSFMNILQIDSFTGLIQLVIYIFPNCWTHAFMSLPLSLGVWKNNRWISWRIRCWFQSQPWSLRAVGVSCSIFTYAVSPRRTCRTLAFIFLWWWIGRWRKVSPSCVAWVVLVATVFFLRLWSWVSLLVGKQLVLAA